MNTLLPFKEAGTRKWLFLAAIPILLAMGCKRVPYICPAYQSAFYLDENYQETTFSAFSEDSLPRIENVVKKSDVMLIAALSKKKKEKAWQTIPMITIFPQPDSALAKAALESGDQMREGVEGEAEGEPTEETDDGEKKEPKELSSDNFYEEEDDEEDEEEPTIDELRDLPEAFPTEGEPNKEEETPKEEDEKVDEEQKEEQPEEAVPAEEKEKEEEEPPAEETEEPKEDPKQEEETDKEEKEPNR